MFKTLFNTFSTNVNTRKPKVSWYIQGVLNRNVGRKWAHYSPVFFHISPVFLPLTLNMFLSAWICLWETQKSSRPEVSCKRDVLGNFAKFTGKHLCQRLRPATLLKKGLWRRCFPVNFTKFIRTPSQTSTMDFFAEFSVINVWIES